MLKEKLKNNKSSKILNFLYSNKIIFLILFVLFFSLCSFGKFSILSKPLKICSICISILIIIIYLLNREYSKFVLAFFNYLILLIISTFLNENANVMDLISAYYLNISIVFYLDLGIKRNAKGIIKSMFFVYFFMVLINFFTLLLLKDGMYSTELYSENWFLGYKNVQSYTFFPFLIFAYLYKKLKSNMNGDYLFVISVLITFISVLLCKSASSTVAFVIFLLYLIIKNIFDKFPFMNIINYCRIHIILFFTLVIYNVTNIFSWLIINILHRELTFHGRTFIWKKIIDLINQKPILGYGYENPLIVSKRLGNSAFTHAHNTYLDVFYRGGIIGFIFFMLLFIKPIKQLNKNKKNQVVKYISFIFFCMMIIMAFEARQVKIGFWVLLITSYNIEYILECLKKSTNQIMKE